MPDAARTDSRDRPQSEGDLPDALFHLTRELGRIREVLSGQRDAANASMTQRASRISRRIRRLAVFAAALDHQTPTKG